MYKRDIINFLFVISFPVFGLGTYVSGGISPTAGFLVGILPHVLILIFYGIDLLYKNEFKLRLNSNYLLMLLFILSSVVSIFVALGNGLPNLNLPVALGHSLLLLVPFHSFIVVYLYNDNSKTFFKKIFASLSLLLLINVVGFFVLGLRNQVHSIEGRINFPFIEAFYSGASLVAILSLMILYFMIRSWNLPVRFTFLTVYLLINLCFMFFINSRLVTMVFVVILLLFVLGAARRFHGILVGSIFTLPILLHAGWLVYEIISLPAFAPIFQRIDLWDVVTFNGRAFLWKNTFDWLLYDQQGILFGNGLKGYYFMNLVSDVAVLFGVDEPYNIHLHSAVLEILVTQGVFGLSLLLIMLYKSGIYYKAKSDAKEGEGVLYPVILFLLFIMHVDGFTYLDNSGGLILTLLLTRVVLKATPAATISGKQLHVPREVSKAVSLEQVS